MAARAASKRFTLFVGNLPWTVSRRELRDYFANFGTVKFASVLFDMDRGLSKGYGFVEFQNKAAYDMALGQDNHVLEKSKLILAPGAQSVAGQRRQQQTS